MRSTDFGCPTYAPSLTTAGDVSVTGNLSAQKFIGDGSELTGITAEATDRIISGTTSVIANQNSNITFTTAGIERLTIDTSGRVGIGTNNPSQRLDVSGAIALSGIVLSGSAATSDNFVVNAEDNSAESGLLVATILGGRSGWPNTIGTTGKPQGSEYSPSGWADDLDYVAGSASIATISGGYDNVVNQLAGTIAGGAHNFIKYNSVGHSIIGGGSYNLVSAGRAGIFSGQRNTVTGNGKVFSYIGGGEENSITGSFSAIPGGRLNSVSGDYAMAFGRRAKAAANGAVALSDSTDADFSVSTPNMFAARYAGGYLLTGGRVLVQYALGVDGALSRFYDLTSDMFLDIRSNTGAAGLSSKHIDIVGGSGSSDLAFSPSTDTRRAMVIKDGGNVGISTTAPLARLDVNGTISASDAIQVGDSSLGCSSGIPGAIRYNTGSLQYCNGASWTSLSSSTTGSGLGDRIISGTTSVIANQGTSITFTTAGIQRAVVGTNGNFGIGTASPDMKLHIASDAAPSGEHNGTQVRISGGTNPLLRLNMGINTSDSYAFVNATNAGNGALPFVVNPQGGSVGIGTTTPTYKLDILNSGNSQKQTLRLLNANTSANATSMINLAVFNGNGGLILEQASNATGPSWATGQYDAFIHTSQANSRLNFAAGVGTNPPQLTLASTGNLGVGTTNPSKTLDVSGTVNITSNTTISGSLQVAGMMTEACAGPSDLGKIRFNPTYKSLELCR